MKVLLVDPSPIFRTGFRVALSETRGAGDLTVVAECSDGTTAARLALALTPKIVVSELHLGDQSGIHLARELARTAPPVHVLLLASQGPELIVHQALAAGAIGYVLKRETAEVIVAAIRSVGHGQAVLPPGVSEPRRRRPKKDEDAADALDPLSRRERQIFEMAVWGSSNMRIAERLRISVKTVETHRGHINRKLRVRSTADMVRLASFLGMLVPAPVPAPIAVSNGVPQQ